MEVAESQKLLMLGLTGLHILVVLADVEWDYKQEIEAASIAKL